jgi:hypothetical protein
MDLLGNVGHAADAPSLIYGDRIALSRKTTQFKAGKVYRRSCEIVAQAVSRSNFHVSIRSGSLVASCVYRKPYPGLLSEESVKLAR